MSASNSERNPVEQLAEEFAARFRAGERPALSEYTSRYPEHAEQIRALFPALVAMEQLKPRQGDLTGDFDGPPCDDAPPRRLGDYRLLREVGRGGMGVVYEAEQVSLGRRVALKVLPPQAKLNPTYLERFRREAKAAARLHHTNIVPVFGTGEADGVPYYAMQFIPGDGLDKVLADLRRLRAASSTEAAAAVSLLLSGLHPPSGPTLIAGGLAAATTTRPRVADSSLSVSGLEWQFYRGVARLGLQVAEALAYAHKQGILHRDVKPSNLLLDAQGTVWVTDFGLAKAEGSEELTSAGDIVGTIRFMAPERFEGRSLPHSDVYALGVTLYEMLTLRPAFEASSKARLIDQVLHEPPVPPRKHDAAIPRDLETVVLKCLAKEPAERYASAEDLAEDLRRFLADRPIKARRASRAEQVWRWCRRNPAVAGLLGTVALLTVAVALISTASALWLRSALTESEAAKSEQKRLLYQGYITEAKYRRFSHREGQRFASLEAIRKAQGLLPGLDMTDAEKQQERDVLRDVAISCLTLPDVRLVREWDGWPDSIRGLDLDYRGELYATSDPQGNVSVRRFADDHEVYRVPGDGKPLQTHLFVPDQDVLIVWRASNQVEGWPIGAARPSFTVRMARYPAVFRVSRDGRSLATMEGDGVMEVFSLPEGVLRLRERLPETDGPILEFSPDGKYLAAIGSRYRREERQVLHVFDLHSGRPPLTLTHPDYIYSVAWYPDSRAIAAAGTNVSNEILVWDVPSGKQLAAFTTQKGGAPYLTINRTGDLLASRATWGSGSLKLWHPQTGEELLTLPTSTDHYNREAPDGRLFAREARGTRIRLTECAPSQVRRGLTRELRSGKGKQHYMPPLHPDGRLLAVGMENGVCLWDLPTGRELAFLPIGQTQSLMFDGTGALWTYGHEGLLCWPTRAAAGGEPALDVGPPQAFYPSPTFNVQMGVSRDGRVAAMALASSDVVVFHRDRPQRPVRIHHRLSDVRDLAVSPDGRYVAAVRFHAPGAKVWDTATGEEVRTPALTEDCWGVGFSEDGKWLVMGSHWYEVGTWREGPGVAGWTIGGGCISPDAETLARYASADGEHTIALIDRASGRRLARLGSPGQSRVYAMTFTPDGTRLIGADQDNLITHVWDLRKLREELKQLGLDWDAPAYPPPEPEPAGAAVPQVRVHLGSLEDDAALGDRPTPEHLRRLVGLNSLVLAFQPFNFKAYRQRGRAYARLDDYRRAIADYSAALLLTPDAAERADLLARRAGNYIWLGEEGRGRADLGEADRLDAARGATARHSLARSLLRRSMRPGRRGGAAGLRDLRLAVRLDPEMGVAHNNLAWLLLAGPPELRAPAEALRHAYRAAELADRPRVYDNTLGVALYRNGEYARAIPALERSLAAGGGETDAYDLYFLAMCHAKLGDKALAKECFERAVRWVESKTGLRAEYAEELRQFRAEAEVALRRP